MMSPSIVLKKTRSLLFSPAKQELPFVIHRKQLYIFPTRLGLIFLLLLLAMLIGSLNYNNNLGLLLTFLLGSMYFVSIFHTYANLLSLEIKSLQSTSVHAGTPVTYEVTLTSTKPLYAVTLTMPNAPAVQQDIPPQVETIVRISMPTLKRGIFQPGPLHIKTEYPLGLIQAWSWLDHKTETLVYAKPIQTFMEDHLITYEQSGGSQGMAEGIDEFASIRPYRPGDTLQKIAWKSSSRGQGIMTKEFQGSGNTLLVLDWWKDREPDPETRISKFTHLVLEADKRGLPVGAHLPGYECAPAFGPTHTRSILSRLALLQV